MVKNRLDEFIALTRKLAEPVSVADALQQIVEAALTFVDADHAALHWRDGGGGTEEKEDHGEARATLIVRASANVLQDDVSPDSAVPDRALPVFARGQGIQGWVWENGRSARVADVVDDPRFERLGSGEPWRSVVAVPLWVDNTVEGVLWASHESSKKFTTKHEGLLLILANTVTALLSRLADEGREHRFPDVKHLLKSPLRLRLCAELIEVGDQGLSLDDAVARTGRHRQDVQVCLKPLVRAHIVELEAGHYRIGKKLPHDILRAVKNNTAKGTNTINRGKHVRNNLLGGMIGIDAKMQMVFELVRQVGRVDVPVLITGETGTGKELVARAIHDTSPRHGKFFGAVNCATLSEGLFESQVFGHMRGSFTGAIQDFVGLAERCHEGTLFLDEVGELSKPNQVKLLRLLQGGSFSRVGDTRIRQTDFRLVSATNRDLERMVATGGFREDLYYRLAVFPIRIPSLRERIGDLCYLVEGILAVHGKRYGGGDEPPELTPEALRMLEKYHWPGNVRELENVMARAVVMAGAGPIRADHLYEVELLSDSPPDSCFPDDDQPPSVDPRRSLNEVQRSHIAKVLRSQRGNIKATANVLGISRTTLYKKIRDYGIDAPV